MVARQGGADGHRGRPTRAVRLDVDPGLEQPVVAGHVRRPGLPVQAADLVQVPPLGPRLLAEARLARLLPVPVRDGRAGGVGLQDRPAAGQSGTPVLRRQPRGRHRQAVRREQVSMERRQR